MTTNISLKQIVSGEKDIDNSRIEEILKNMVIINLKQKIEDDDDDEEEEKKKKKIRQCYGMDELFNKIFK